MKLLVVLICLGLQSFLNVGKNWPRKDWINQSIAWIEKALADKGWQAETLITRHAFIISMIAIPALLVGLLCVLMCQLAWGLVGLVYSVAILLLCMIPQTWVTKKDVMALAALPKEEDEATEAEEETSSKDLSAAATKSSGQGLPAYIDSLQNDFFSVLFWYILLGPFGAMASYLSSFYSRATYQESDTQAVARHVQAIVVWLPTRLLMLTFCLAGQFLQTFNQVIRGVISTWGLNAQQQWLVDAIGAAAGEKVKVNAKTPTKNIAGLLQRTLILWLVLLAVLTITALVA